MNTTITKNRHNKIKRKYYSLLLIFLLVISIGVTYVAWNFITEPVQKNVNMSQAINYGYADLYLYYLFQTQQLKIDTLLIYYLGQQNWTNPHPQIPEYDYIIGQISGSPTIYYAEKTSTGKIAYSGTNASLVIQNSINALPDNKGTIFFKAGRYYIDTTINVPYSVYIIGTSSSQTNGTIFTVTSGLDLAFNFSGDGFHGRGKMISLVVCGNGESESIGIQINEFLWFYIEDIIVVGFDININILDNYGCLIENSRISASLSYGILSTNNTSDIVSTSLVVSYCDFSPRSGWCIGLNRSYRNIISGNWFETGASYNASHILVLDSKGTRILGNMIGETRTNNNYGVKIESVTEPFDETIISGNTFALTGKAIEVSSNCNNGIIDGNSFVASSFDNDTISINSSFWIISNNRIRIGDIGILITANNNEIEGNTITGCHEAGIKVSTYFSTIHGNNIFTCEYGIISGGGKNKVSGNYVAECNADGIFISSANSSVTDNFVRDNAKVIGTCSGIALSNVQYVFVSVNFIPNSTTQQYGIKELGTSDNNVIFGNMVGTGTAGDILVIGANTVSEHNYPFT